MNGPTHVFRGSLFSMTLLFLILFPLVSEAASAPEPVLPKTPFSLPSSRLLITLDHATIKLSWNSEKDAQLGYNTESNSAAAALQLLRKNSAFCEILRPEPLEEGPDEVSVRLDLSFNLLPGQAVEIRGEDLEVLAGGMTDRKDLPVASAETPENNSAPGDDAPAIDSIFQAQLKQSRLVLQSAAPAGRIKAENSTVEIFGARQPVELELAGGQLKVSGAEAPLEITAGDTSIDLSTRSSSILHLRKSQVSATGFMPSLTCDATDSYFDFFRIRGNIELSGSGSTFNFSDAQLGKVEISGEDQTLYLDGAGQLLRTNLSRSSVEVPHWSGRIEAILRASSSFELESLDGDLLFSVADDSELKLSGITGHLRGQSHDSHMVFKHLKSMEVDIWNSRLEVSDLKEITKLGASASEVEISAPELRAQPKIGLLNRSTLELELPAPCIIELKNPIDDWSSVLDAPNCGVKVNGQLSGNISRGRRGGPQPIRAEVTIDASSSMKAEVPL